MPTMTTTHPGDRAEYLSSSSSSSSFFYSLNSPLPSSTISLLANFGSSATSATPPAPTVRSSARNEHRRSYSVLSRRSSSSPTPVPQPLQSVTSTNSTLSPPSLPESSQTPTVRKRRSGILLKAGAKFDRRSKQVVPPLPSTAKQDVAAAVASPTAISFKTQPIERRTSETRPPLAHQSPNMRFPSAAHRFDPKAALQATRSKTDTDGVYTNLATGSSLLRPISDQYEPLSLTVPSSWAIRNTDGNKGLGMTGIAAFEGEPTVTVSVERPSCSGSSEAGDSVRTASTASSLPVTPTSLQFATESFDILNTPTWTLEELRSFRQAAEQLEKETQRLRGLRGQGDGSGSPMEKGPKAELAEAPSPQTAPVPLGTTSPRTERKLRRKPAPVPTPRDLEPPSPTTKPRRLAVRHSLIVAPMQGLNPSTDSIPQLMARTESDESDKSAHSGSKGWGAGPPIHSMSLLRDDPLASESRANALKSASRRRPFYLNGKAAQSALEFGSSLPSLSFSRKQDSYPAHAAGPSLAPISGRPSLAPRTVSTVGPFASAPPTIQELRSLAADVAVDFTRRGSSTTTATTATTASVAAASQDASNSSVSVAGAGSAPERDVVPSIVPHCAPLQQAPTPSPAQPQAPAQPLSTRQLPPVPEPEVRTLSLKKSERFLGKHKKLSRFLGKGPIAP